MWNMDFLFELRVTKNKRDHVTLPCTLPANTDTLILPRHSSAKAWTYFVWTIRTVLFYIKLSTQAKRDFYRC